MQCGIPNSSSIRFLDGCRLLPALLALLVAHAATAQSASISQSPVFTLKDGEGSATFEEVRAVLLAEDGTIVVAERPSGRLSIFTPDGLLRLSIGGAAWADVTGVWLAPNGMIGIYDWKSFAVHYASPKSGAVERTSSLQSPPDAPRGVPAFFGGEFSDGSIAIGWVVGSALSLGAKAADRIVLARFAQDGTFLNYVGEGEGFHRLLGSPVYHSPFPYADTHESAQYYTNGLNPQIVAWDESGALVGTLRWQKPERQNKRQEIPSLSKMFVDNRGRIWAKIYNPDTDAIVPGGRRLIRGGDWWIVESGKAPIRLQMHAEVAPYEVRNDLLLGVRLSGSQSEEVVVYRVDVPR